MKRKPVLFALSAVTVALMALLSLRRPPPVPPPLAIHPTAQQSARAAHHLGALEQELQPEAPRRESSRPGRPIASPKASPPRPRTLRLSEEDLNVYLAGNPAARKMLAARGVKTVQIILSEPAHLTIRAAVSIKGHTQDLQLDGRLSPDPKLGLRYTATRAQVGRFPLPPAVVTTQANALAARLADQLHGRLPLRVQSVQVQGKMLVLTGLLVKRAPLKAPAPASPRGVSPAHR